MTLFKRALHAAAVAAVLALPLLQGCAPLVIGGAMAGGTLVAVDRRTTAAQLEDQGIELKSSGRLGEALAGRGHVNVTSYNRQVLLTGEVPSPQDKTLAERAVAAIDNVRAVVNELAVMGNSSLGQRSSDTMQTAKVKSTLIDTRDLSANTIKVVTERGTTYLMGLVTQRESARAAEVVRGVSGVVRVVRVFELVSEADLAHLHVSQPPATADAPQPQPQPQPPVAAPSSATPAAAPVQVMPVVQTTPVQAPLMQATPLPQAAPASGAVAAPPPGKGAGVPFTPVVE